MLLLDAWEERRSSNREEAPECSLLAPAAPQVQQTFFNMDCPQPTKSQLTKVPANTPPACPLLSCLSRQSYLV